MRIRFAQITQNHSQIGYAWYPRRAVASFPVERLSEVTLWRHRVTVRFLSIAFDINELQTWGWCHSVRLVKAHHRQLICNKTYLGHTVTLTWRDLRSNFEIDLSRKNIWIDPTWRVEHDGVKIVPLALVVKKLFMKKRTFFLWWPLILTVLGWPPIWGHRSIAEIQGYHLAMVRSTIDRPVKRRFYTRPILILPKTCLYGYLVKSKLTSSDL